MAFLGALLGLALTERSRASSGVNRGRWLVLAAFAVGGTGAWLMHFLALLGLDIPTATIRYDPGRTAASLGVVVVGMIAGLFVVGFGRPNVYKIVVSGLLAGAGIAGMHFVGVTAVHFGGRFVVHAPLVVATFATAAVAGTVLMWFAVSVRGPAATAGAAALLAVALCSMHYTGMAAVDFRLDGVTGPNDGMSPFMMLGPVAGLACLLISGLAYATVGFAIRRENAREDALLAHARDVHEAGAILYLGGARHR